MYKKYKFKHSSDIFAVRPYEHVERYSILQNNIYILSVPASEIEGNASWELKDDTKTSKEWFNEIPKEHGVIILDPDGWDRENYDYSFNQERISYIEFNRRLCSSTIKANHSFFNL